jgi:sugar lactone lactonase YvrE
MAFEKPELVLPVENRCGEGPVWDANRQCLLWADIEPGLLHEFEPTTGQLNQCAVGFSFSAIALTEKTALILGGPRGLDLWCGPGKAAIPLQRDGAGEPLAINDMVADARGCIYAGTIFWGANGRERFGKLWLLSPNAPPQIVDDGIELANGLGFSPDQRTLYLTDSAARRILAYDVEPQTGLLRNKRSFTQVSRNEGLPDGLKVDSLGYVWSAQWYGAQIVRYDPDGKVERRIKMPMSQVASLAFGGRDLTDLYVTTAGELWRSDFAPPGFDFAAPNLGGPLFRIRVEVPGQSEHRARFAEGP